MVSNDESGAVLKIYKTYNYSLFKSLPGNRDIRHEKVLKESIKRNGFLMEPILVNERMEIINGQGRFTACVELGLPIYYVIQAGLGINHCRVLNMRQTNWTIKDWISSYATEQVDYKYLESLMKQFPTIPPQCCARAASWRYNSGSFAAIVQSGTFTCTKEQYEKGVKTLEIIKELQPAVKHVSGRLSYLYDAMTFCINCKAINTRKFVKRVEKNAFRIDGVVNIEDAVGRLDEVYNRGTRAEDRVDILVEYRREARMGERSKK